MIDEFLVGGGVKVKLQPPLTITCSICWCMAQNISAC
jgi:hypothetical protein